MNGLGNSSTLYLEISQSSLKALNGEAGLELLLERLPNGRLTAACKEKVAGSLRNFLDRKGWQPRARALCAIGARGVSLRRLSLPATGREEFQRLLLMQIESEFPLTPGELAWGYRSLGESQQNGSAKQDLLVMAVKKDVVEEYSEILSGCGLSPVFTLAALARSLVSPQPVGTCALLDVGPGNSELILFEDGVPTTVRVFPWGDQNIRATEEALDALAKSLNGAWTGRKLFLSGNVAGVRDLLAQRLGADCETLTVAASEGRSAAVLGLKKSAEENRGLLLFQAQPANGKAGAAHPAPLKWAVLAGVLAVGLLVRPYAEAILFKPLLEKKLTKLKSEAARLPVIDRELDFLQSLKQSQPPYLDALYVFAKCAPSGSRIDSVTMNRRGDVTLRGSMRSADQVAEFRTKLNDSGFFSSVTVDEQTPGSDRKVNVRMTVQWKTYEQRQHLAIGPTPQEIEKAKTNSVAAPGMPGGMPGGMPPGMPPGMPSGPPPVMSLPPGVTLPPGVKLPPGVTVSPGGPSVINVTDMPAGFRIETKP